MQFKHLSYFRNWPSYQKSLILYSFYVINNFIRSLSPGDFFLLPFDGEKFHQSLNDDGNNSPENIFHLTFSTIFFGSILCFSFVLALFLSRFFPWISEHKNQSNRANKLTTRHYIHWNAIVDNIIIFFILLLCLSSKWIKMWEMINEMCKLFQSEWRKKLRIEMDLKDFDFRVKSIESKKAFHIGLKW